MRRGASYIRASSSAKILCTTRMRGLDCNSWWVTSQIGTEIGVMSGRRLITPGVRSATSRSIAATPIPRLTISQTATAKSEKTHEPEISGFHRDADLARIAGKSRRIVETDQTRFGQISRTFRQAVAGNPVFRRIEARFGIADVLADQAGAVEAHMADGYVRFPAMQVAEFVCGDDHDSDLWDFQSDALDDFGQNMDGNRIGGARWTPAR